MLRQYSLCTKQLLFLIGQTERLYFLMIRTDNSEFEKTDIGFSRSISNGIGILKFLVKKLICTITLLFDYALRISYGTHCIL